MRPFFHSWFCFVLKQASNPILIRRKISDRYFLRCFYSDILSLGRIKIMNSVDYLFEILQLPILFQVHQWHMIPSWFGFSYDLIVNKSSQFVPTRRLITFFSSFSSSQNIWFNNAIKVINLFSMRLNVGDSRHMTSIMWTTVKQRNSIFLEWHFTRKVWIYSRNVAFYVIWCILAFFLFLRKPFFSWLLSIFLEPINKQKSAI